MKVPKEIAEKVRRYTALKNEADELFQELDKFFEDDCCFNEDFFTTPDHIGKDQGDGYCDQTMIGEDWGNGTYYYPVEDDSNEYVAVRYSF